MESLRDYGYSGMDDGIKVYHFLQGFKSTEFEAAINVVWSKQRIIKTDFDATISYLSQMITKKGASIQSVHISITRSQPGKPKVAALMKKENAKISQGSLKFHDKSAADAG